MLRVSRLHVSKSTKTYVTEGEVFYYNFVFEIFFLDFIYKSFRKKKYNLGICD